MRMPSCGCVPGGPYCDEARMLMEAYERAAERDDAEAAAALDAVRAHVPAPSLDAFERDDIGDPTAPSARHTRLRTALTCSGPDGGGLSGGPPGEGAAGTPEPVREGGLVGIASRVMAAGRRPRGAVRHYALPR